MEHIIAKMTLMPSHGGLILPGTIVSIPADISLDEAKHFVSVGAADVFVPEGSKPATKPSNKPSKNTDTGLLDEGL